MGIVVVVCGKICDKLCGKICGKMCGNIEKLSDWNKNWCVVDMDPMIMIVVTKRQKGKKTKKYKNTKQNKKLKTKKKAQMAPMPSTGAKTRGP